MASPGRTLDGHLRRARPTRLSTTATTPTDRNRKRIRGQLERPPGSWMTTMPVDFQSDVRLNFLLYDKQYILLYWLFSSLHCVCVCLIMCSRHSNTGWPKKLAHFLYALTSYALTSSNIDRLSNLFHSLNKENICHYTVTKNPTTRQVCRYTLLYEMSVS